MKQQPRTRAGRTARGALAVLAAYLLFVQALAAGFACAAGLGGGDAGATSHILCVKATDDAAAVPPGAPSDHEDCECAACRLGSGQATVPPPGRQMLALAAEPAERLAPASTLVSLRARAAGTPGDARAPPSFSA